MCVWNLASVPPVEPDPQQQTFRSHYNKRLVLCSDDRSESGDTDLYPLPLD